MALSHSLALLGAAKVTTVPDVSIGHLLGHTVVALLVIVGGIWGVQKVWLRQRSRTATRGGRPGSALQIVSRHSLGKDQHLAIVRWGEREVLVGISGSHISFFEDGASPPPSEHQAMLDGSGLTTEAPTPPLRSARSAFAGAFGAAKASTPPPAPFNGFRPVLERLRDLTERS